MDSTTTTTSTSTLSEELLDSPTFNISRTYDDELLFMQNFFATQPHLDHNDDNYINQPQTFHVVDQNNDVSLQTKDTHLYSDLYVSYMLNGGASADDYGYDDAMNMEL